jgi:hypothetical protein
MSDSTAKEIICCRCGQETLFYTIAPYGSKDDGDPICAKCLDIVGSFTPDKREPEPKLCPYAPVGQYRKYNASARPDWYVEAHESLGKGFGPCLQEKCAMWRCYSLEPEGRSGSVFYCGLGGKQ